MAILRNSKSIGRDHSARAAFWKILASTCVFGACLLLSGSPLLSTLHAQEKANSSPNYGLEGDWIRIDVAGSGDYTNLNKNVPDAKLTPAGQALLAKTERAMAARTLSLKQANENAPHQAGEAYVVVTNPCETIGAVGSVNEGDGTLTFNPNSNGFHMIVGKDQVIWTGERGGARIIWMDGRKLPNESDWTRPIHISVGHWENGVLVVNTVGLTKIGVGSGVPGKGVLEPTTTLTEHFELMPGGKKMKVTYTWWDPKLYVKPHSYTYTFGRAIPPYALEDWCNPGSPLSYQSIVPPSQNQQ